MQGGDGFLVVVVGGVEVGYVYVVEVNGGDGRVVVVELMGFYVLSFVGGKENVVIFCFVLVWIKFIIMVLLFVFFK